MAEASAREVKKLSRGETYRLVIALREKLTAMDNRDADLLLRQFSVSSFEDFSSLAERLQDASEADVIELAEFLEVPVPGTVEVAVPEPDNIQRIDAYTELVAAETALREVVRIALGEEWKSNLDADGISKLESKRTEEQKRRDGITVSTDLLDYTETFFLQKLINKHWDKFKPVLDDKARTDVYLGLLLDVRNTIAHSRPVVPSERLLIAGAAGQIQNQIARFRSQSDGPHAHYASINYVRDSFGEELRNRASSQSFIPRLSVGQEITFECSATDPKGRGIAWRFTYYNPRNPYKDNVVVGAFEGTTGTVTWKVTEDLVGEKRQIAASIRNSSKYHRENGTDDLLTFYYHVNPPI